MDLLKSWFKYVAISFAAIGALGLLIGVPVAIILRLGEKNPLGAIMAVAFWIAVATGTAVWVGEEF